MHNVGTNPAVCFHILHDALVKKAEFERYLLLTIHNTTKRDKGSVMRLRRDGKLPMFRIRTVEI